MFSRKQTSELLDENIFTSITYDSYSTPTEFCYDVLCKSQEPIIDDEDSPLYNLQKKVSKAHLWK